jgi:imidazole glycerol-phosphate synthase subunit HisF
MLKTRVIPCLLLRNHGLVKTLKFKEPKYVGDPVNAVKIFNEKEVDELSLLDITATIERRKPDFSLIRDIASECFMPLSYGGGIRSIEDIKEIFALGAEKVIINSYAFENPNFISEASSLFGSQSIVVSIDVKKRFQNKYETYICSGTKTTGLDPISFAVKMASLGAGEIFLNSIDRDGTQQGYDLDLIRRMTAVLDIPVIACGGAGSLEDFADAVHKAGASAVAAGSFFVFHGKHRAVLISYPEYQVLERILG